MVWLGAATATTAIGCAASTDGADAPGASIPGGDGDAPQSAGYGQTVCRATTRDARGPYWEPGAPLRATRIAELDEPGVRLFLEGRLVGPDCRTPLADYVLDVWQADAAGNYHAAGGDDYRLRGKIKTDSLGRYRLETILPGRYGDAAGIRPAHLHVTFLTPGGNELLTTQLYFEGDPYLGEADYCTREGTCNSSDPARVLALRDAWGSSQVGKTAFFEAVLPRT